MYLYILAHVGKMCACKLPTTLKYQNTETNFNNGIGYWGRAGLGSLASPVLLRLKTVYYFYRR